MNAVAAVRAECRTFAALAAAVWAMSLAWVWTVEGVALVAVTALGAAACVMCVSQAGAARRCTALIREAAHAP
jgi:drug/metabolite transporter superfamily protein YnfA